MPEQAYRLTCEQRIRNGKQFQQVFKRRKRIFAPYYSLYYCTNRLPQARIGVVVGKRNVRFAVDRNRVKRIAKERFRLLQHQLHGLDVVLVAHKQANQASRQELQQCLEKLFDKLIMR